MSDKTFNRGDRVKLVKMPVEGMCEGALNQEDAQNWVEMLSRLGIEVEDVGVIGGVNDDATYTVTFDGKPSVDIPKECLEAV